MIVTKRQIVCPGCGKIVVAVAWDGVIKGLCTVSHKQVWIKVD